MISRGAFHLRFSSKPYTLSSTYSRNEKNMGACVCGYTRDPEKNCDGTHKVVKAVKEDTAEKLEANGFPHAAEYVRTKLV